MGKWTTRGGQRKATKGEFFFAGSEKIIQKIGESVTGNDFEKAFGRFLYCLYCRDTIPKRNIAPKNGWLEDELTPFWDGLFSGAMLVSGRVIKLLHGSAVTLAQLPKI